MEYFRARMGRVDSQQGWWNPLKVDESRKEKAADYSVAFL